jgi:glycerol-3-phosphate dehydrogenase
MPIVTALQSCLSGAMDIDTAIHTLMSRPLQAEFQ